MSVILRGEKRELQMECKGVESTGKPMADAKVPPKASYLVGLWEVGTVAW
jgi:hypothetical protein